MAIAVVVFPTPPRWLPTVSFSIGNSAPSPELVLLHASTPGNCSLQPATVRKCDHRSASGIGSWAQCRESLRPAKIATCSCLAAFFAFGIVCPMIHYDSCARNTPRLFPEPWSLRRKPSKPASRTRWYFHLSIDGLSIVIRWPNIEYPLMQHPCASIDDRCRISMDAPSSYL
jgi:hypothetical protein